MDRNSREADEDPQVGFSDSSPSELSTCYKKRSRLRQPFRTVKGTLSDLDRRAITKAK